MAKEIQTLEAALQAKTDALKLAETRLENRFDHFYKSTKNWLAYRVIFRSYRPGFELTRDEAEQGLKDEVLQLRQTRNDLQDKINCAKATYNALEDQQVVIDRELDNKNQSLMTDIRCLDLRARLRQGKFAGPGSQTDRNIELTRMEKEIPPT